jgi:hypothetical protein
VAPLDREARREVDHKNRNRQFKECMSAAIFGAESGGQYFIRLVNIKRSTGLIDTLEVTVFILLPGRSAETSSNRPPIPPMVLSLFAGTREGRTAPTGRAWPLLTTDPNLLAGNL